MDQINVELPLPQPVYAPSMHKIYHMTFWTESIFNTYFPDITKVKDIYPANMYYKTINSYSTKAVQYIIEYHALLGLPPPIFKKHICNMTDNQIPINMVLSVSSDNYSVFDLMSIYMPRQDPSLSKKGTNNINQKTTFNYIKSATIYPSYPLVGNYADDVPVPKLPNLVPLTLNNKNLNTLGEYEELTKKVFLIAEVINGASTDSNFHFENDIVNKIETLTDHLYNGALGIFNKVVVSNKEHNNHLITSCLRVYCGYVSLERIPYVTDNIHIYKSVHLIVQTKLDNDNVFAATTNTEREKYGKHWLIYMITNAIVKFLLAKYRVE